MESNDFTGTLPTELGLVTSLQHFKLNYVDLNIGTTLPTELGKLSELQTLNLRWANIAGTLPTEYGHMKSLVDLDISHNDDLIGTFPTEYGYLKNLSKFCAFFMIILLGLLCLLFAVLFSVGCHLCPSTKLFFVSPHFVDYFRNCTFRRNVITWTCIRN